MRSKSKSTLTYAGSGVNYEKIDPAKLLGQRLGKKTFRKFSNLEEVLPCEGFRGESAYVFRDDGNNSFAHIEEGLGTKIKVADAVYKMKRTVSGYHCVAIDTVAMIVNDLATLGIPPVSIQMHLAVGDDAWLNDQKRIRSLFKGWYDGCIQSMAVWTGGETPVLRGVVAPDSAVLAGSAIGWTSGNPIRERISPNDVIIGLASSGVHANGITLLRKIGERQPDKGLRLFQEALQPTVIYVKAMHRLRLAGIQPHYAIHVTGHGWRKLMRAKPEFTYRIKRLQPVPRIFKMIQRLGPVLENEMWGNYNMGTGFVLIVSEFDENATLAACRAAGYKAKTLGWVEKGPKRVIIEPIGLTFEADSMNIR